MNNKEEFLKLIDKKISCIQFIENASEETQLAAVKHDEYLIQFIKNPSEKIQLEAVKKNGYLIQCIDNPSEEVIRTSILNGVKKEYLGHIDISKLSDETRLMIELL